jgi:hypothetical protein
MDRISKDSGMIVLLMNTLIGRIARTKDAQIAIVSLDTLFTTRKNIRIASKEKNTESNLPDSSDTPVIANINARIY